MNKIQKKYLYCILVFLILSAPAIGAFGRLSLNVESLIAKQWDIKKAKISLLDIYDEKQQLNLSIEQLALPKPFSEIKLVDISCLVFKWQESRIVCESGQARLISTTISRSPFQISFSISEKASHFNFQNIPIVGGLLSLKAKEKNGNWSVLIDCKNVKLKALEYLIKSKLIIVDEMTNGLMSAHIDLKGDVNGLNKVLIKAKFNNVSFQAKKETIATEALNFDFNLLVTKQNGNWRWEHNNHISQGEMYIDPVYINIKEGGVALQTKGIYQDNGDVLVDQASITLPNIMRLNAEGILKGKTKFYIESAKAQIDFKDLEYFSANYLPAFVEQTALEGITFKGKLSAQITLTGSKIKQIYSQFSDFTIQDIKQRIELFNSFGDIYWSTDPTVNSPSAVQWEHLKVRGVPFDAGRLDFLIDNSSIELLQGSSIPMLGGMFTINQFNWKHNVDNDPTVYFEGEISSVSLDGLSQSLNWTPLTGNISGKIPGVEYKNKILNVNGKLNVEVFDGNININKLASSGLFTDSPKFYMDMEMNNLDLHSITQKLKMGEIEGRVSGFMNNLYLENWEPVTFYAWLGTPEGDNSTHRISQKAVENIASIGGGGAADLISKGFLRFFDTFKYDRLGFGCYLHQGVCQLMGVDAADKGYYIVKGGGVPRIDVIGFNPRVDWKVLIQRLSRISDTNNLVIE